MTKYISPSIGVIQIEIEKGFAASPGGPAEGDIGIGGWNDEFTTGGDVN